MRLIALIFLLASSVSAAAQALDCKAISDAAARLACYDRAAPPVAAAGPRTGANSPRSKVDSEKYMESLSTEDALVTARMKGICRGC
jgi:hypothetical protein